VRRSESADKSKAKKRAV